MISVATIQNSNASWITAQRWDSAGPRLYRARDASLEHQWVTPRHQKQQAGRSEKRSNEAEITMMASISKRSAQWKTRRSSRIFFEISENCAKLLWKACGRQIFLTIMAYSSKRSPKPKNRIGRKKISERVPDFFLLSPSLSLEPKLSGAWLNLQLGSDRIWWKAKIGKQKET